MNRKQNATLQQLDTALGAAKICASDVADWLEKPTGPDEVLRSLIQLQKELSQARIAILNLTIAVYDEQSSAIYKELEGNQEVTYLCQICDKEDSRNDKWPNCDCGESGFKNWTRHFNRQTHSK